MDLCTLPTKKKLLLSPTNIACTLFILMCTLYKVIRDSSNGAASKAIAITDM